MKLLLMMTLFSTFLSLNSCKHRKSNVGVEQKSAGAEQNTRDRSTSANVSFHLKESSTAQLIFKIDHSLDNLDNLELRAVVIPSANLNDAPDIDGQAPQ